MLKSASAIAALILLLAPAMAGETPWQEVAPGVQLRLISTGQLKPDGTTLVALELDMPQGTKTYWRVPGETGLPTELDFSATPDVTGHQMLWPYPVREERDGYLDYAYFGDTVLPVELTLEPGAERIQVNATMGICSDICVPAQANFTLTLDDLAPDRANGLRIRQALAMVPIDWTDPRQPLGDVVYDPASAMLSVHVGDDAVDRESLIAATSSGMPVFGAPQISPEPGVVLIPVLGDVEGLDLAGQTVQLSFTTGMGAFELSRTIKPASGQ
ncbi:protein-disulfide reductase DsbD domain-containing protein [Devosia aquimaris]|uniref:protein-disulfide reductase DsbD domain-containing protein n=1 Tax=Devosia aquimaris TaxID=2866214 RepID=UPI001CD0A374|nr:protein-disulfide reductase DsbD domain-containing protein [Devosia sp. CJK-A8-3]